MNKYLLKIKENIFRVTPLKRRALFFLGDSLIITFSLYASFWLRFDGSISAEYKIKFPTYFGLVLIVKLSLLAAFEMYGFLSGFSGSAIW